MSEAIPIQASMRPERGSPAAALCASTLLAAVALAGSASRPKPIAQLVRAKTLVTQAENGQAQRSAPMDLQRARRAARCAQSAVRSPVRRCPQPRRQSGGGCRSGECPGRERQGAAAAAYNQTLAAARAQAVAQALQLRGVSPDQYRTIGLGEACPVASNGTAAGRQQNRRVNVVFSNASGKFSEAALSRKSAISKR